MPSAYGYLKGRVLLINFQMEVREDSEKWFENGAYFLEHCDCYTCRMF